MAQNGRPTKYTKDLASNICAELACGKSMRTVCKADDMPAMSTVFLWLRTYPAFSEQYAHAKREAADAMAEEILDISDDGTNDWVERERKDGSTYLAIDHEAIQRSKLRVDTRKFIMAKMKPKVYGDKIDITSDGERLETAPVIISEIKPRGQDVRKRVSKKSS